MCFRSGKIEMINFDIYQSFTASFSTSLIFIYFPFVSIMEFDEVVSSLLDDHWIVYDWITVNTAVCYPV